MRVTIPVSALFPSKSGMQLVLVAGPLLTIRCRCRVPRELTVVLDATFPAGKARRFTQPRTGSERIIRRFKQLDGRRHRKLMLLLIISAALQDDGDDEDGFCRPQSSPSAADHNAEDCRRKHGIVSFQFVETADEEVDSVCKFRIR